jgi:hypothetical protein
VVDVDALGRHADYGEGVALGGEVLRLGGDARIADQQTGHDGKCVPYVGRFTGHFSERVLRDTSRRAVGRRHRERAGSRSPYAAVSELGA